MKCILQNASSWDKTASEIDRETECIDLLSLIKDNNLSYGLMYRSFSDFCSNTDEKVDLCGLSLGAVLALNYAVDYPQKVNSLVLIAGQYKMPKALLRFQSLMFRLMPETAFSETGLRKAEMLKLTRTMTDIDLTDKLKDITCPTLVLCGENDRSNKKASRELGCLINNARTEFVNGSGHEVNKDKPSELAEILNDFLSPQK